MITLESSSTSKILQTCPISCIDAFCFFRDREEGADAVRRTPSLSFPEENLIFISTRNQKRPLLYIEPGMDLNSHSNDKI